MIDIRPYNPYWASEYSDIAAQIRAGLGGIALEIHHIGSTSINNMPAKDVIDVQITVTNLLTPIDDIMTQLGYIRAQPIMDHCPAGADIPVTELKKKLYKLERRPANVHVRENGRLNQQFSVLSRDYLRANQRVSAAYAQIKMALAQRAPLDEDGYYEIKDPVFDIIFAGATVWAGTVAWKMPISDL